MGEARETTVRARSGARGVDADPETSWRMEGRPRAMGAGMRAGRVGRPVIAARLGALVVGLGLAATGCVGPRSLELTRLRYDQAVHQTTEQQWLRHIVRLRYGDLPSFLDVSAITSQFELSGRGSVTGGQQRDSVNRTYFGDLALQFRDAPTLATPPATRPS